LSTGPQRDLRVSDDDGCVDLLQDLHDAARDGVVSAAAARRLGIGPDHLAAWVRAGDLRRLVRGWYAVRVPGAPAPWEAPTPHESARRLHLLTTIALVRSFAGRVVASHHSALLLHGVSLWRSDLRTVHVSRAADDHTRHRRGAVIHPACGFDPVDAGPCLTVPVATAVVQVGLRPRHRGASFPLESLVAADSALHLGLVTPEGLADVVAQHAGHPGIGPVRAVLAHADGRHESVGETRLAHVVRLLGHETEPQSVRRVGGHNYRGDLRIRGTRVLLEFDGLTKYLPDDEVPDLRRARSVIAAEKLRQDQLVEAGDELVRVTWRELDDSVALDRRIAAAIERSRRRRPA
jgi:hypothetical protein